MDIDMGPQEALFMGIDMISSMKVLLHAEYDRLQPQ